MINVSHIVNTVFASRTYILSAEGCTDVWLVDCGDVDTLLNQLSSLSNSALSIRGVMLTHVHYDHIYGLPRLLELFPKATVYTNVFGERALSDERLNYSRYHDDPIVFESDNVITCDEGEKIDLFDGLFAKVYATPGHSPSCLTFEVGEFLFTGDAYIPGFKVVTTFKGGDKKLAAESVERIVRLAEGKMICPGHEEKV